MDGNTVLAKRPPLLHQRLLPHLYAIIIFFLMMAASSGAADVRPAGGAGDSQTPPVPIVLLPGQTYAQNFDGLAAHGTDHPFPPEEKSGLEAGWWTSRPTYSASTGSSAQGGGLFSYGQEGSGERALGSLTSNQMHHTAWGVAFMVNEHETSDTYLWALEVAYNGEQWSAGGFNRTSTLVFDYSIVSTADYERSQKWGFDVTPGLWMVKDRLSFTSPVTGGEERELNGNEPANRRAVKHTLAIDDWGKDKIVQLRWTHRDREGKDNAMAIDDFSVTLVPLREVRGSAAAHHRKRTWLYAGISVVGAGLLLIIAGLVITLIIKRRRNAREGEHSYALLRRDEEGGDGLGPGNTSINPPEVDDADSVRPGYASESWLSSGL